MNNILALDPGIHCGWAVSANGRVESGVMVFDLGRGDSPGMRFVRFNFWLANTLELVVPELVVYERPHMRGGFATDLLVGFSTRIQEACAMRGIEYEAIHSATLKKAACGSGRADKAAMMKAASERFGRVITSDDEADALSLLWMVIKRGGPGPERKL